MKSVSKMSASEAAAFFAKAAEYVARVNAGVGGVRPYRVAVIRNGAGGFAPFLAFKAGFGSPKALEAQPEFVEWVHLKWQSK